MRHLILPILVLVGLTTLGELVFDTKTSPPSHKSADVSMKQVAPAAAAAPAFK